MSDFVIWIDNASNRASLILDFRADRVAGIGPAGTERVKRPRFFVRQNQRLPIPSFVPVFFFLPKCPSLVNFGGCHLFPPFS